MALAEPELARFERAADPPGRRVRWARRPGGRPPPLRRDRRGDGRRAGQAVPAGAGVPVDPRPVEPPAPGRRGRLTAAGAALRRRAGPEPAGTPRPRTTSVRARSSPAERLRS